MVKVGRILLIGAIALGGIVALSMLARAAAPPAVVASVDLSFPAKTTSTAKVDIPSLSGRYIDLTFTEMDFYGYTPVNVYPLKITRVKVETTETSYEECPEKELSINETYRVTLPTAAKITKIEVSIVNPKFTHWFEMMGRYLTVSTSCRIRADILA